MVLKSFAEILFLNRPCFDHRVLFEYRRPNSALAGQHEVSMELRLTVLDEWNALRGESHKAFHPLHPQLQPVYLFLRSRRWL